MSSTALSTTFRLLYALAKHDFISEKTILLYTFIVMHGGGSIPSRNLIEATRSGATTVKKHLAILEYLGLIEVSVEAHHKPRNFRFFFVLEDELEGGYRLLLNTSYSSNSRNPSTSDILEQLDSSTYEECVHLRRMLKSRNLEEAATYEDDEDWLRVRDTLSSRFTNREIYGGSPTSKRMFTKIYSLIDDDELDFEAYADWYKQVKYPEKGFNWPLFTYPGMVDEFKMTAGKDAEALRTSSEKRKQSHERNAHEDEAFYENLMKSRRRQ